MHRSCSLSRSACSSPGWRAQRRPTRPPPRRGPPRSSPRSTLPGVPASATSRLEAPAHGERRRPVLLSRGRLGVADRRVDRERDGAGGNFLVGRGRHPRARRLPARGRDHRGVDLDPRWRRRGSGGRNGRRRLVADHRSRRARPACRRDRELPDAARRLGDARGARPDELDIVGRAALRLERRDRPQGTSRRRARRAPGGLGARGRRRDGERPRRPCADDSRGPRADRADQRPAALAARAFRRGRRSRPRRPRARRRRRRASQGTRSPARRRSSCSRRRR